jgi:hypothetical protein
VSIHAGQLKFVFEVGHRTQAAQDHASTGLFNERGEQTIKALHLHIRQVSQRQPGQRDAFPDAEMRTLAGAVGHRDDHLVEQRRGARHQIRVTIGDRIESTWIDSYTRIAQGVALTTTTVPCRLA